MTDIQALGYLFLLLGGAVALLVLWKGKTSKGRPRLRCNKCKAVIDKPGTYRLCAACIEAIRSRRAREHQQNVIRVREVAENCGFDPFHATDMLLQGRDADELCQAMIDDEMERGRRALGIQMTSAPSPRRVDAEAVPEVESGASERRRLKIDLEAVVNWTEE